MQRPIPWLWILVIGVLLIAPGFAARLLVDVVEGFALLLVFGPLVLAGAGFLAWQWFRRRLITCPACGTSLKPVESGTSASTDQPASSAVIDVQVQDVSNEP